MPRLAEMDCRAGHGKACRSRPWRIVATCFCICPCHAPLFRWWRRPRDGEFTDEDQAELRYRLHHDRSR